MKNHFKNLKSIPEIAKILRISREAVLKQVNKGKLVAKKIGRNYVVYFKGRQK